MADVQHSTLTDPELHEPKGVASANEGEAYIADGAGSGDWAPVQPSMYGCIRLITGQTTSGISTAYQVIDNATLSISYDSSVLSNGVTASTTGGYLTFTNGGTYHMVVTVGIRGTAAADRHYAFTIGVDSGSGFAEQSSIVTAYRSTDNTTDTGTVAIGCIPSFSAGDKVCLMLKVDTGTVSELEIRSINFTFVRVA